MGSGLAQEITSARPLGAGPEWWLLLDMALDADDATRLTSCGYEYMSRRTRAPRSTIYRWLKRLRDDGLVVTVAKAAGTRGGGVGKRAVYEIRSPLTAQPPLRAAPADMAEDERETDLYRWRDEIGLLLYIGISDDLNTRTRDHGKKSTWMEFASGEPSVEYFPSRSDALKAERAAIEAEHPLFNVQYNDTPEARRWLVEYLVMRDRLDLLIPAVSRG